MIIRCRRRCAQLATDDALIAQGCIVNDCTLLSTDEDFAHAARHIPIEVWRLT